MEPNQTAIKYVALYLRKSRGESEADLRKQKTQLEDMCLENNWTYVEYCEVESGESLAIRPVMQKLLKDVESEVYDAVLVVDIDRLGRGDLGDQDKIKKAFMKSGTLVVDERSVYNLANDQDEFVVDIRGFLARQEYKQIVKRLVRGKRVGSRLGNWTNGTAPFPYEYQQWQDKFNKQGLVVNDDKLLVYNKIKELFLVYKKTPRAIAADLNTEGVPSPKGNLWSGVTVQRLMLDETHLGRIVSNKTVGDAHKIKKPSAKDYKRIPQEEWLRVENCHEPVKTLDEHEQIRCLLIQRKLGISRTRKPTFALSGLIKCGKCGRTMTYDKREDHGTSLKLKPCWYRDPFGNKCGNRGGRVGIVTVELNKQLAEFEQALTDKLRKYRPDTIGMINKIAELEREISQQDKQVHFIYEQYEKGIYSREIFTKRIEKAEEKLAELQDKLKGWQLQLKVAESQSDEDRLARLALFRAKLAGVLSAADLNELYKTLVDRIEWTREGDEVTVKINFL